MGIVITRSKALAAASANCICLSQTPGAAGNLTLNGSSVVNGVAVLDTARRVLLTFAANETGHTFVVYGTNSSNSLIQESIAGTTAGTVYTNQDFKTVTRISISAAATGAIQAGTNTIGSLTWQSVDMMRQPVNVGFQIAVTGTVNYTVEYTNQDVNVLAVGVFPTVFPHQSIVGMTDNESGSFTDPIAYFRVTINSGTGTVALSYEQAGP